MPAWRVVRGCNLLEHLSARGPRAPLSTFCALAVLGLLALIFYFDWCRHQGGATSLGLGLALALLAIYNWAQPLGNWFLYPMIRRSPAAPSAPRDLTVDAFVTAYKEPVALIERSLRAACEMRGEPSHLASG